MRRKSERRVAGVDPRLDNRDRALVLRMSGVRVEMLVQCGRRTKDAGEEERAERREGDGSAAIHDGDCVAVMQEVQPVQLNSKAARGSVSALRSITVIPTEVEESLTSFWHSVRRPQVSLRSD